LILLMFLLLQPERNWSERNGIGDSTAVGIPAGGGGVSGSSGVPVDWNGTPSSSPRKEFSSHNRNMENWRRNRNEDGSGDGPTGPTGNLAGIEAAGWRSGANHRWGKSFRKMPPFFLNIDNVCNFRTLN